MDESRKPHKCPHCSQRFTPREMEIDEAYDDHLRDDHNINLPPENFFYIEEAEKRERTAPRLPARSRFWPAPRSRRGWKTP